MANRDQKSNKLSKKPKKDTGPVRESSPSDRPVAPTTAVIPRGKEKNK